MVRVAIAILLLLLLPSAGSAEPRIALVITNQTYTQAGARLTNTHRDGDLVKAALEKVGFKVWVAKDTGNEHALLQAIGEHVQRLTEAGRDAVGFFYYSGHGAADRPNGENYLIPTNVPLTHASQLPLMAVRLEKITATLASAGRMSFVVFDACRNVPLQREQKDLAFKGFVPVREQRGLLVAFATDPGNVAVDQSVYAKALADEIVKPGLEAGQVFRAVTRRVLKDTEDKQSPEYLDKRLSDFHFAAAVSVADREVAALKEQLAKMDSDLKLQQQTGAGTAKEMAALKEALAKSEAELKRREENLKKQEVVVAIPPKPPAPPPAKSPQPAVAVPPPKAPSPPKPVEPAVAVPSPTAFPRCDGIATTVGNERRCLKHKATFRDCADCPEMVVVPAGEFIMGSRSTISAQPGVDNPTAVGEMDYNWESNEGPRRRISIARPLAVGKYEVTFEEWEACRAAGDCRHQPRDGGWGRGRRPVIDVSWDDIIKEFLPWLSRKTTKTYRLLTEMEWEYAARAGTSTVFSTGQSITTRQANFDGMRSWYDGSNSHFPIKGLDRNKTVEVGSFPANRFGLHDMHGNVWEWVADCYNNRYLGNAREERQCSSTKPHCPIEYLATVDLGKVVNSSDDPLAEVAGCARVIRGGSWRDSPISLRSASRKENSTDVRSDRIGFRLARTLSP